MKSHLICRSTASHSPSTNYFHFASHSQGDVRKLSVAVGCPTELCKKRESEAALADDSLGLIPAEMRLVLQLDGDGRITRLPRLFRIWLGDTASPDVAGTLVLADERDGATFDVEVFYLTRSGEYESVITFQGLVSLREWKGRAESSFVVAAAEVPLVFSAEYPNGNNVAHGTFSLGVKEPFGLKKDGSVVVGQVQGAAVTWTGYEVKNFYCKKMFTRIHFI